MIMQNSFLPLAFGVLVTVVLARATDASSGADKQPMHLALDAQAGATAFEQSLHRKPWSNLAWGIELKNSRWGLRTGLSAQQRNYGGKNLRGAEGEIASRCALTPNLSLSARLALSPYRIFDSLYASQTCDFEINSGLPAGLEADAAARLRVYGKIFSPFYSLGLGKYLGRFLISGRMFIAPFDKKNYLSASADLRMYSIRDEKAYCQFGSAFGRTPFDAGAITSDGYLSFTEFSVKSRFRISRTIAALPMVIAGGEQLTRTGDFNADGEMDVSHSPIRMRFSLSITVFWEKEK
jgi:YaiO family outer membrane protein